MKIKKIILTIICFSISILTVYAASLNFKFETKSLFTSNNKQNSIENKFSDEYKLSYSLDTENDEIENEIINLTKKTIYLLLGDTNNNSESAENYYKRKQDFYNSASYNYFPTDENSNSGYDETNPLYVYAVAAGYTIPQMFSKFNELGIIYSSYGDIKVTFSKDIVISTITLPNVKMKEEDSTNPMNYTTIKTNLIIYLYFIKIDDNYRLTFLYGDTTDNVNEYFNELEDYETNSMKAIQVSYDSSLSSIYNFDKVNKLTDNEIDNIYNENAKNIVYLKSYYNNKILSSANGIFINEGIILTTWSFLEEALVNSQYILISDLEGNNYEMNGIITINSKTNVALIKLKNKINNKVKLSNSNSINIEDPAVVLSSKSGFGLTIQKGIVVSNEKYLQTSIPLSKSDEGSPVFNSSGQLIGLNTSKSTDSEISIAININVIKEIQDKFNTIDFDSIKTITFDDLKEEFYYTKYNSEKIVNSIPNSKWKKYKTIGDIENTIKLELIKASYKDGIVSLRYKNSISNYISSMQLSTLYKEKLEQQGYKNILDTDTKSIYSNDKYKVIIMDELEYLIIVMVKL